MSRVKRVKRTLDRQVLSRQALQDIDPNNWSKRVAKLIMNDFIAADCVLRANDATFSRLFIVATNAVVLARPHCTRAR